MKSTSSVVAVTKIPSTTLFSAREEIIIQKLTSFKKAVNQLTLSNQRIRQFKPSDNNTQQSCIRPRTPT